MRQDLNNTFESMKAANGKDTSNSIEDLNSNHNEKCVKTNESLREITRDKDKQTVENKLTC